MSILEFASVPISLTLAVTAQVIETVDELAKEAKEMIAFMSETVKDGYDKLLKTSENYQGDVGKIPVLPPLLWISLFSAVRTSPYRQPVFSSPVAPALLFHISANVNQLLAYIRSIMQNIAQNSGQLTRSSTTIAGELSDAQMSVSDISATMEQMRAAMEQSSAALDQINEAVWQAFGLIEQVNRQAEDGSSSSGQIMRHASQIYEKAVQEQQETKKRVADMARSVPRQHPQS